MSTNAPRYDIVIAGGRVIDPESGLDAIRNVGISGGSVTAVTEATLSGTTTVDAAGMVVCPGFIDLHSHGQDAENYRLQALDGVTTALELELGTDDVDRWYADREGKAVINYGVSAGHIPVRMSVMRDPGDFLPLGDGAHRAASDAEVAEMAQMMEHGLQRGALAAGFGMMYTPAATRWEVLEVFRAAGRFGVSCHVHLRGHGMTEPNSSIEALGEAIASAVVAGTPLHVVHLQSTGREAVPRLLEMIEQTGTRGIDVTTECYPYSAGMTRIDSSSFDDGWQESRTITYQDLEWPETGERLTAESFARYRKQGGMVIAHGIPEDAVDVAVSSPLTMIASDGYMKDGKGHPRTAGTYSRILGKYVRELGTVSISDAVRKMALMPAQRLEHRAPVMKKKGRLQVGSDADLTVFDPDRIIDTSTYQRPTTPPEGIMHVLVNGVPVVTDGRLVEDASPGQGARAPAG